MSQSVTPRIRIQRSSTPKVQPSLPSKTTAAFQNRKTLADYVRDNMSAQNRRSYYQRIILLGQNKESQQSFIKKTKKIFNSVVTKCNDNLVEEQLTGLYLYYEEYAMIIMEASEDVIGIYLKEMHKIQQDLFEVMKVLLFVNNIKKVHFDEIIWRTCEPPSTLEKLDEESTETFVLAQNTVLNKLERLCSVLSRDLIKGATTSDDETLSISYVKVLPTIKMVRHILKSQHLFNIIDYANSFRKLPSIEDYDDRIWPIPYDYTPLDVFQTGKYDVNLTFKDAKFASS